MEALIVGVMVVFIISLFASSMTKNVARAQGHQKCQFCGAHLKVKPSNQGFGYADHCAKCGRAQPWAKA